MDKTRVVEEMHRLYAKYNVSTEMLENLSEDRIRGIKGLLAELDFKKCCDYTDNDKEIIKEIFFYYC